MAPLARRNNAHTVIHTITINLRFHTQRHAVLSEDAVRDPSSLNKSIQTIMEEIIIGSFNSWFKCAILCWNTGGFLFSCAFSWVQPRLVMITGLDERVCDTQT